MSKEKCRHCDRLVNLSKLLCDECVQKALHVLPSSPRERIQVYKILVNSPNPIIKMAAEQLMVEDYEAIDDEMTDPVDRMFDPRG